MTGHCMESIERMNDVGILLDVCPAFCLSFGFDVVYSVFGSVKQSVYVHRSCYHAVIYRCPLRHERRPRCALSSPHLIAIQHHAFRPSCSSPRRFSSQHLLFTAHLSAQAPNATSRLPRVQSPSPSCRRPCSRTSYQYMHSGYDRYGNLTFVSHRRSTSVGPVVCLLSLLRAL